VTTGGTGIDARQGQRTYFSSGFTPALEPM